jgi:hypothetical protein
MMIRIISLLFLISLALLPGVGQTPSDEIPADEYSVYSDLINSRFIDAATKLAVIKSHTEIEGRATIPSEFETDLRPKTDRSYALLKRFHLRSDYVLITDDEANRLIIDDPKGGDSFWKTYPKSTGLLVLSRVAFDATKTKAFACVAQVCGPLCGYGYAFVLEKQNGSWKIRDEKKLWIS